MNAINKAKRLLTWDSFHKRMFVSMGCLLLLGLCAFLWVYQTTKQYQLESFQQNSALLSESMAKQGLKALRQEDRAELDSLLNSYIKLPGIRRAQIVSNDGKSLGHLVLENNSVKQLDQNPMSLPIQTGHSLLDNGTILSRWEAIKVNNEVLAFSNLEFTLLPAAGKANLIFWRMLAIGVFLILLLFLSFLAHFWYLQTLDSSLSALALSTDPAVLKRPHIFQKLNEALRHTAKQSHHFEQLAQDHHRHLQALLSTSYDAHLLIDEHFHIQASNQATERIFNYKLSDLIGKPIHMLYHPPFSTKDIGQMRHFSLSARGANNETFPVKVSSRQITLSENIHYTMTIYDNSATRKNERYVQEIDRAHKLVETYKQKQEAITLILNSMDQGLCICNKDGELEYANPALLRLSGYNTKELRPQLAQLFAANKDDVKAIKSPKVQTFEADIVHAKGHVVELNASWIPRWDHGKLTGNITLFTDVSAHKILDAKLSLAKEKIKQIKKEKNELLSRMSHELRTPLNAILGFAQLLDLENLSPDQSHSVHRILKAGHNLLKLINHVLDISRLEVTGLSKPLEPLQLDLMIEENLDLIQPLAQKQNIFLNPYQANQDFYVLADQQRFNQIMLNLLSNAIKYNREGGKVSVKSHKHGQRIRIEVSDTGLGIPQEKMNRLFTAFDRLDAEQTEIEGTGIGLALTKGLVTAMNGDIGVKSTINQGSTFWIDLPSAQLKPDTTLTPPLDLKTRPDFTVAYIEDNLSNIALIEKIFQRFSKPRLLTAMQGHIGIDLIRNQQPDLVILDLHLPDISGEEVLERLKANPHTRAIPIIMLSADTLDSTIKRLTQKGAYTYLAKPLSIPKVLDVVESFKMRKLSTAQTGHEHTLSIPSLEANDILHLVEKLSRHPVAKEGQENPALLSHLQTLSNQLNTFSMMNQGLAKHSQETLNHLARMAESKLDPTGEHADRIGRLSGLTAKHLGLNLDSSKQILQAAKLHDIGVMAVSESILLKPGQLTPDERLLMQTHSSLGAELLSHHKSKLLSLAETIAGTHHEHWDGSGYPRQLQKDAIPIEGRIVAVADVYDALTRPRPYKTVWPQETATDYLVKQKDQHFDPEVVDAFVDVIKKQDSKEIQDLEESLNLPLWSQPPLET